MENGCIVCIFINSIKNLLFLNISNRYIVTYKIKNILKQIKSFSLITMKIQLTQQIIVSNKSDKFAPLDELCFLSKNVYNVALYQHLEENFMLIANIKKHRCFKNILEQIL